MVVLQIQWKGEQYQHGDPGYQNAVRICPSPRVFGECEFFNLNRKWIVFICHWWTTQLILVFPQLKGALLVDRVEQKEDHVLVYLQEVRGIHSKEQIICSRFVTNVAFVFLSTANKGNTHQPHLRAHTAALSTEPEASCGQDLWLLPAK